MKIVICDSDVENNEKLKEILINECNPFLNIRTFTSEFGLEMYLDSTKSGLPELVIISTVIGNVNCINVAKKLRQKYPSICIIFTSNTCSDVNYIFEAEPIYFLYRPVISKQVCKAYKRLLSVVDSNASCKLLNINGKKLFLDTSKIIHIESDARKLTIHLADSDIVFYAKLDELMPYLKRNICRIHQSYAVNFNQILSICKGTVKLKDGNELPISRSRYDEVVRLYDEYLDNFLSSAFKNVNQEEDI